MNAPILASLLVLASLPAAANNDEDDARRALREARKTAATVADARPIEPAPPAAPSAPRSFFDILTTEGEIAPDASGVGKHVKRVLPDGRDESLEAIVVFSKDAARYASPANPRRYSHILAYRQLHTPLGGGRLRGDSTEITATLGGRINTADVLSAEGRKSDPYVFRADGPATKRVLAPDSPEAQETWKRIVDALSAKTPQQP